MMSQPRIQIYTFAKIASIGALFALIPTACIWEDSKRSADESGGTAGTNSGGSTASGGSGGETSPGGASNGGSTNATTTVPEITCISDRQCTDAGLLCDLDRSKCVECLLDDDCTNGVACVSGVCGGQPAGCSGNEDCASSSSGHTCDPQRGRCVACNAADDCEDPANSDCVNHQCVAIKACKNSLDCKEASAAVCDREASPARCVACVADGDCAAVQEGQICANYQCVSPCSGDDDCTGGLKCNINESPSFCSECISSADCDESKYCDKGSCVADVCAANVDEACIEGGVATCNAEGSAFGTPEACTDGKACTVADSRASCGSTTSGCTNNAGTVDPCKKIPKYTGTQVVDGLGDDFCSVPMFELSFKNAAGVNNSKITGNGTDGLTQYAVARVGWTAEAFVGYVEVFGKPVRANSDPGRIWDGDSVELMITTNANPPGLTSEDPNAIHVILNYSQGVTVKSDATSGTHTPITDVTLAKMRYTDNGYAAEIRIPWTGSASVASGSQVRFEMALNVDSASVDPDVWGRDAQAVLAMTALTGTSTCSATPATPFCDERLWCPTKLE